MDQENGELFTEVVRAGNRTYFFDVKETCEKVKYLKIKESKQTDAGFEHYRVMVFEEDLAPFFEGLTKAMVFLELNQEEVPEITREDKSEVGKAFSVDEIREEHPRAYEKWSADEDDLLAEKFYDGLSNAELASFFERKPGAIRSRLKKLGLTRK